MADAAAVARLKALASRVDAPLETGQADALLAYCDLLLQWNVRINLTGARSVEELVDGHLVDALVLAREVHSGTAVDVGAGGGLPGVPFAVLRPDVALTLVEPRAKRVAFLRTAVRELRLSQVVVEQARVEDLVGRRLFDAAWSRATFAPAEWLPKGLSLVVPGGRVFVLAHEETRPAPDAPPARTVRYEGRELRVSVRPGG